MSDYMEYYEFYKKHWERSLSERTSDMQKEIETLRAETARYREALECYRKALWHYAHPSNSKDTWDTSIAREALHSIPTEALKGGE